MELLGVGPGEILLILVIMLLVFGPERLPEFARQAGLFVVRVRDWIQRSPDAALVLRARAELESELQAIRAEQDAAAVSKIELPDAAAQSAEAPSIAPPASNPSAPTPSLPVQEPESAALSEFDVDPGPIGARRARIAEVAEARQAATPPPAPTIAGGETVARGARIEPPAQPARIVTDDSPFAANMARIDDLSRQVASIAEELARLRVILLQRMAEEKRHQAHIDSVSPVETVALNRVRDAETLHNGAVSSDHDQALPDNTPAPPRGVEALP